MKVINVFILALLMGAPVSLFGMYNSKLFAYINVVIFDECIQKRFGEKRNDWCELDDLKKDARAFINNRTRQNQQALHTNLDQMQDDIENYIYATKQAKLIASLKIDKALAVISPQIMKTKLSNQR